MVHRLGYVWDNVILFFEIQFNEVNEVISVYTSVQGLDNVAVANYADIEERMAEGTRNRTVAATNMNATSR